MGTIWGLTIPINIFLIIFGVWVVWVVILKKRHRINSPLPLQQNITQNQWNLFFFRWGSVSLSRLSIILYVRACAPVRNVTGLNQQFFFVYCKSLAARVSCWFGYKRVHLGNKIFSFSNINQPRIYNALNAWGKMMYNAMSWDYTFQIVCVVQHCTLFSQVWGTLLQVQEVCPKDSCYVARLYIHLYRQQAWWISLYVLFS